MISVDFDNIIPRCGDDDGEPSGEWVINNCLSPRLMAAEAEIKILSQMREQGEEFITESLIQQMEEKDNIIADQEDIIEKLHQQLDRLQEENRNLRQGNIVTHHISHVPDGD